jgi:predicted O-methyltransferase YrrM
MFTLDSDFLEAVLRGTLPSYQATSLEDQNLGYGFLFYAFARLIRPATVVVLGSKAGFSAVLFAAALRDNSGTTIAEVACYSTILARPGAKGMVHLVDPSYSEKRGDPNHWHGVGFWNDAQSVQKHWQRFGISDYVRHYKMTSQEFLNDCACPSVVDLLYIDGDHSYEGIRHDFDGFYPLLRAGAIVLAHDVDPALKEREPETGGYEALRDLDRAKFEVCRLPIFPGMAIARKRG